MAETTSLAFPNMFNITANQVSVIEDTVSVANRSRLLILTDPTELYNNPDFGVGLRKYLWQYNNENVRGLVKDKITEQLRTYEPCVLADQTQYSDGLLFSESPTQNTAYDNNTLALTVAMQTIFREEAKIDLNYELSKSELDKGI